MQKRNFVLRTIVDGKVQIDGKVFVPSSRFMEYDGRLNGMRYAFGLYWCSDELEPYVSLWGTEEAYRAVGAPEYDDMEWPGPDAVDGYFPWAWWYVEERSGS